MKNARFLSSLEFVGVKSSKNQIFPNVVPTGEFAVSLHIKAVAHDAGTHSTECYTLDGRGPLKKCKQATNLYLRCNRGFAQRENAVGNEPRIKRI